MQGGRSDVPQTSKQASKGTCNDKMRKVVKRACERITVREDGEPS